MSDCENCTRLQSERDEQRKLLDSVESLFSEPPIFDNQLLNAVKQLIALGAELKAYVSQIATGLGKLRARYSILVKQLCPDDSYGPDDETIDKACNAICKERDQLRAERDEFQTQLGTLAQQFDALSNLICNASDTLRSRGFEAPTPFDERVIKLAQAYDALMSIAVAANSDAPIPKYWDDIEKAITAAQEKGIEIK